LDVNAGVILYLNGRFEIVGEKHAAAARERAAARVAQDAM
jgi:hypothetical protein